jgi:predicted metal-dependent enzyme (double-stranded beta helix superfamily)
MSAVAPAIDHFPARTQPGQAGRGTPPPLPTRPKPSRASLSPPALAVMAEGLASVVTAESVPLRPGIDRSFSKLLATEDYEVWLIAWAPTGALDLHDHGGSTGVVRVVAGELVEAYTDLVERQRLRSATFGPGETVALPPTRVHEVWNPGPRPALSIHIYSPPLTTMTFYDHRPDHFLAPRRTESGELPG